jgi:transporter family protein
VEDIPSNLATLIRTSVVLLFLAVLVVVRNEWRDTSLLSSRGLLFLILSGLATALSWICYYRALQLGPASLVAPIDKLSVAVAVILAVLFLGERLTAWQWAGSALVVAGAVLIAFPR